MTAGPVRVVRVKPAPVRVVSVVRQGRPGAKGNDGQPGPPGLAMLTITGGLLIGAGTPESPLSLAGVATAAALTAHASDTSNPHGVTAAQIGAATTGALGSHTSDTNNPHGVTAGQIGAATTAALNAHAGATSNPHNTTAAQVGLGNVLNVAQVPASALGQPSGVATLGADGKITPTQAYITTVAGRMGDVTLTTADVVGAAQQSDLTLLQNRVGAVETGQTSGVIGYATLAAMNADLAHPAGAVAFVGTDPTASANGNYIKVGASGAGSWSPAATNGVLSRVGSTVSTTTYPTRNTPGSGTYTASYEASNFRRFGSTIGVVQDFDRVQVHVRQWDGARPITSLTLTVRDTSQTGTVLATKTLSGLSLSTGADNLVTFDLTSVIANASASQLWVDIDCNGVMGMYDMLSGSAYYSSITGYPGWNLLSGSHGLWVQTSKATVTTNLALTTEMQSLIGLAPVVVANTTFNVNVGTLKPVIGSVQTSGLPSGQDNNSSTFSGWGSPVGVRTAFDYVAFRINPWSTLPGTPQIRLRIRENDSAGNILYDVTQDLPSLVAAGGAQLVEFYLPTQINTAVPLYIEYFCNFKTGREVILATTYPTTSGYGQARYSTSGSTTTTTLGAAGTQFNLYYKFGLQTVARKVAPALSLASAINPNWGASLTVPSTLWAVVGREMNVYYANILNAFSPTSHFWFDVTDSANKGIEQAERYTITPTSGQTGSSTLSFDLFFGGQKIASKSSTLTIKAATTGAGIVRKWLPIGDSTTAAGVYVAEITQQLASGAAGAFKMTSVGTKSVVPAGGYTTTLMEGISGWTVKQFYTDPTSPFVFSGVFNFAQYLTTNSLTLASGDWATFHLDINDIFASTDDDAVMTTTATMISQLNAMMTNMQAAVPGLRMAIFEPIPPSASQDAFGASYGTNYSRSRYRRNHDLSISLLQAAFEGRTGSNVWYVQFGCNLDTVNNMQLAAAAPINARTSTTTQRQVNGVHPDVPGYQQIADAGFAFFKCQET